MTEAIAGALLRRCQDAYVEDATANRHEIVLTSEVRKKTSLTLCPLKAMAKAISCH